MSDAVEHSIPAVHALHLVDVVARWNVSADDLLAELGLRADELSHPEARLTIPALERLVERARRLTGEPALGFYLGLQMRISAHGYLGIAAMASATVRDALDVATRFAPTRTSVIGLRLHVDGDVASLVIEERADLRTARDVVIFALVVGIWQIGMALTGKPLFGKADVAFPAPKYVARLRTATAEWPMRFDQPVNQLVFDAALLDLPLNLSDPSTLRLAREQCERALAALGQTEGTVTAVRRHLRRDDGGFRSLDEVAARLHVSPRTLKRKLAIERAAFSELLAEERRESALLLLRSGELSLEQIAERLGYSDLANFTRAFRRWTGQPPGAFRRAKP